MVRTSQLCKSYLRVLQEDSQTRNIGLFFFNRRDAESLIEKVGSHVHRSADQNVPCAPLKCTSTQSSQCRLLSRVECSRWQPLQVKQENPKLGRESSVTQVGMDSVYQFATAPRAETGMQGVIFRFMPDAAQVDAAVKVRTDIQYSIMHAKWFGALSLI